MWCFGVWHTREMRLESVSASCTSTASSWFWTGRSSLLYPRSWNRWWMSLSSSFLHQHPGTHARAHAQTRITEFFVGLNFQPHAAAATAARTSSPPPPFPSGCFPLKTPPRLFVYFFSHLRQLPANTRRLSPSPCFWITRMITSSWHINVQNVIKRLRDLV